MKIVIQRVSEASVLINGAVRRETGPGLLILLGIAPGDTGDTAAFMASKTASLRIFDDENGSMNLSLFGTGGEALVISNFTLYADCKKGRRPSFTNAAPPSFAEPLCQKFTEALLTAGVKRVETGLFGADMKVSLVNDGPVTVILDSDEIMSTQHKRDGG